jgi:hypothetical protein
MAQIKYSPLVTEMRGHTGGAIYSRNASGMYVKSWAKPRNPPSTYSRVNRNEWQVLIRKWSLLTEAQRKLWTAAAKNITWINKVGDKYNPTGQLLFLQYCQNLFLAGINPTYNYVSPGTYRLIQQIALTPFDDTYSSILLNLSGGDPTAPIIYLIYSTPALSTGINYAYKYFRYIGSVAANAASPVDIFTMYSNRFLRLYSNEKIFIKLRPIDINSGAAGIELFCSTIVNNSGSTPMLMGMLDFSYTFLS